MRRAWIEITTDEVLTNEEQTSLSLRRAWIEISCPILLPLRGLVALLAESVDRNGNAKRYKAVIDVVALLAESVDRNAKCTCNF